MKKKSIVRVKGQFVRWRGARNGRRSRVPLKLRQMALELRADHSDDQICEELGIYRSYLRRWQLKNKREADHGSPMPKSKRRMKRKEALAFIEVSPTDPVAAKATTEAVTLEWQRADGARMQMSGSLDSSQIVALAAQFLARR